jgi:hypothetical protein
MVTITLFPYEFDRLPRSFQAQLMSDYPYIPKPYITQTFFQSNQLYVPTHFKLEADQKTVPLPYKHKTQPSRITGKAKVLVDPEFEQERAWLVGKLGKLSVSFVSPDRH